MYELEYTYQTTRGIAVRQVNYHYREIAIYTAVRTLQMEDVLTLHLKRLHHTIISYRAEPKTSREDYGP